MTSLGQELRQERERQGIPLEAISQATKISLRFLTALEADRLELLPGRFFARAIIRSYANYLGLDEKAILARYETIFRLPETVHRPKKAELPAKRRLPFSLVLSLLIMIIIIAWAYFLFRPAGEKGQNLSPQVSLRESNLIPGLVHKPVNAGEPELPKPITQLHLQITFQQRTWIQVYADGVLKLDGIKNPGATFETTADKELLLHLGNAGGIDFSLNGLKGKSLGRSGAVVKNIKITLENMKDFVEPPTDQPETRENEPGINPGT